MDKEIAQKVPDVDVVVGGHTNTFLYNGEPPSNEVCRKIKGQLISICLLGVFNSPEKNEREQFDLRYHNSKNKLFC